MRKKPLLWIVWLVLLIGATACGGATPEAANPSTDLPTDQPTEALTDTAPAALPPTAAPSPTVEVPAADETAIDPAIAALLPAAPAGASEFRSDSAEVVGATGRPQLVEFFTFW